MVAIIEHSRSIRQTLQYNEQKVEEQKARIIDAHYFIKQTGDLSLSDKLLRFKDLHQLNERSQAKTIHISVNFHQGDNLEDDAMKQIVRKFMDKLGFGRQPYLVYRHIDAGHPHAHVVTTNIRPDGSRISNDNLAPFRLKQICAELEQTHRLITALGEKPEPKNDWSKRYAPRMKYGEQPTKTGIARILAETFEQYAYESLDHFNALLGLYLIRADRGAEGGLMYKSRGLYYRIIDERGVKIGAPIKASAFAIRPTLDRLEQHFETSRPLLERKMFMVKNCIDSIIDGKVNSFEKFDDRLAERGISLYLHKPRPKRNRQAQPEPLSMFYVDHERKAVFMDKDLGDKYTLMSILQRTGLEEELIRLLRQDVLQFDDPQKRQQLEYPEIKQALKAELLLQLVPRHNEIVTQQQREQQLTQRQSYRLRI